LPVVDPETRALVEEVERPRVDGDLDPETGETLLTEVRAALGYAL